MKRLIVIAATAVLLVAAPSASAFDPDEFGLSPINDGPGPAQEVPALPDVTNAFWGGTCDRSSAPALGQPILPDTGPGAGIGVYSATVLAPHGGGNPYQPVTAPAVPNHCLDWGGIGSFANALPWLQPPSWRLPAQFRAGGHPDGTAVFAFNRSVAGQVHGSVDNIVVDLPPGLAGDPNAVPQCSSEVFSARPLLCPPQTQVGTLNLEIQAVAGGGLNNPGGNNERIYPVYNIEPRRGNIAELGFGYASGEEAVTVRIVGKARTSSDHGVTFFVGQIPAALQVRAQEITIWGVPWAAENDAWRVPADLRPDGVCSVQPGIVGKVNIYIPPSGLTAPGCAQHYDPSWGPIEPFFSNVTQCTGSDLSTRAWLDEFQQPGNFISDGRPADPVSGKYGFANGYPDPTDGDWRTYTAPAPPMSGCDQVQFHPSVTLEPVKQGGAANQATDSPSGLDAELTIPQHELPFDPPPVGAPQIDVDQYVADAAAYWKSDQGLATSHLEDTVVTLPEGMTLNPAGADGQGACTMEQIGVTDTDSPESPAIRFDNGAVECPESSKVGEVVVETPFLDEADWPTGSVYLAQQGANPFGSDFAIYIAIESPDRGLIVKLAGKVTPDPLTGQLTTTFLENPQLPFDTFSLKFKGGPRAPLATPTTCGTHTSTNSFTPYSAPNAPVTVNDPFNITSSPAGGCAATPAERPFSLGFSAGSTDLVAGTHSAFTARFTRPDGNQELDRIELTTPEGLAAKLAGVPYCSEASIAQAQGRTASGDGALEQANPSCPSSSKVGTTTIGAGAGSQPFFVKGDVYLAGPYKGAPVSLAFVVPAVAGPFDLGVQVVRTALQVNPKTAQVTAVSDTIPKILAGVPLRIRDVRVDIDRNGFILNPTDCAEQKVTGKVYGASGASTEVSNRFQIAECARLGFKPSLTLKLKGGTKRAKYQGLSAVVVPRPGDANIASTAVTMPRSAFLAQEHIRTVCTRVQFAADACPAGSIYGKAKAWSPLLDEPLSGNVYLRSSSNKLPDLVADLRGPASQPIRVELSGRTDSFKRALRNTFDIVPDAPVSRFELELFGGQKGLIVNSQDLCRKKHFATVKMTGQNGREHNFRPVVKNSCKKIKPKKGKKSKQGKKGSAKQRPVSSLRSLAQIARGLF